MHRAQLGLQPSHSGCIAVESKIAEVLNGSNRPTAASGMAALAVKVGRLLHGLALWTAKLFSVAHGATAIGMRTLSITCHCWLRSFCQRSFFDPSAELGFILCLPGPQSYPAIQGNIGRTDRSAQSYWSNSPRLRTSSDGKQRHEASNFNSPPLNAQRFCRLESP